MENKRGLQLGLLLGNSNLEILERWGERFGIITLKVHKEVTYVDSWSIFREIYSQKVPDKKYGTDVLELGHFFFYGGIVVILVFFPLPTI